MTEPPSTDLAAREITLTRVLDAPPADVFRAWTDPDHLGWFYNDRQPAPPDPIEVDLRVGGAWRQKMIVNDDLEYVTGGVYREIVPDEKLVFAFGAVGGWPDIDPDDLDSAPLVTITFTELGGRTRLDLHMSVPADLAGLAVDEAMLRAMASGWNDTVDRLVHEVAVTGPTPSAADDR